MQHKFTTECFMHVNKSYIYAKSIAFFFFLVLHTCTITFVVWQFNDTTALRLYDCRVYLMMMMMTICTAQIYIHAATACSSPFQRQSHSVKQLPTSYAPPQKKKKMLKINEYFCGNGMKPRKNNKRIHYKLAKQNSKHKNLIEERITNHITFSKTLSRDKGNMLGESIVVCRLRR